MESSSKSTGYFTVQSKTDSTYLLGGENEKTQEVRYGQLITAPYCNFKVEKN